MAKNIPQRDTIKRRTINYMKELGTYKTQYNQVIDVFVDMLYQYNYLSREFERSGFEISIETEKSGGKKSPIFASLETLRKDIGTYSDKLMLNAKSNQTDGAQGNKEKKESAFSAFIKNSGQ